MTFSLSNVSVQSAWILYVTFPPTMPYSEEDKYIIKHYRERYGWGSLKIFNELGQDPGKNWTRNGISYLIRKIDATGSIERKKGSGRPRSARTQEN